MKFEDRCLDLEKYLGKITLPETIMDVENHLFLEENAHGAIFR